MQIWLRTNETGTFVIHNKVRLTALSARVTDTVNPLIARKLKDKFVEVEQIELTGESFRNYVLSLFASK